MEELVSCQQSISDAMCEWIEHDSCPRERKRGQHSHAKVHSNGAEDDHQTDRDHVALRHEADDDSQCEPQSHLTGSVVRNERFEEEANRAKKEHESLRRSGCA